MLAHPERKKTVPSANATGLKTAAMWGELSVSELLAKYFFCDMAKVMKNLKKYHSN